MDCGQDAAVVAPVRWREVLSTQVIPDVGRRQLLGEMITQEVPETGNYIAWPGDQGTGIGVQDVPQAPLVDGADVDPLQPAPRLLARYTRPCAAHLIPRRPLVLGRSEPGLELGKVCGHHRALSQLLQVGCRQGGEEFASRRQLLTEPLTESGQHPA